MPTAAEALTQAAIDRGHQPYTATDAGGSAVVLRIPGTPDQIQISGECADREAYVDYPGHQHRALTVVLAPHGDELDPAARLLAYCDTGDLTTDAADAIAAAETVL
uniref:hypothetical protein n=1 Tax=unclassified Streptomyces TaxID=2593676 RepID=UPI003F496283